MVGARSKKAKGPKASIKEADLYSPIKRFLEASGYEVKGEVLDCDVAAVAKDGTLVAVELKVNLNLRLIVQGVDRMDVADFVYVGVPESDSFYQKNRAEVTKTLKRLGMGLLLVNPRRGTVIPVVSPTEYKPRKLKKKRERLLREFSELKGDPNLGGSSTRQKKMTVYRQKALDIAAFLVAHGDSKASIVRQALEIPTALEIMYQNHYGWFEAKGKGVYGLTEKGLLEFSTWQPLVRDHS